MRHIRKKVSFIKASALLLLFLSLPSAARGGLVHSYAATSSDGDFTTLEVRVEVDNYDEDINCGGLKFWGVQAVEHISGKTYAGSPRFVSSGTLSQTFIVSLPPGDYEELTYTCSDDGENLAFQHGSIENEPGGDQILFSTPMPIEPKENLFERMLGLLTSVEDVPEPPLAPETLPDTPEEVIVVSDTNDPSITLPFDTEMGSSTPTEETDMATSSTSADAETTETVTTSF